MTEIVERRAEAMRQVALARDDGRPEVLAAARRQFRRDLSITPTVLDTSPPKNRDALTELQRPTRARIIQTVYGAAVRPGRVDVVKVGRNDRCLCGSGVKFKRCCGSG